MCKCNQPSWRRRSSVFGHGAYFCGVAPQQITPQSQQQHHHYVDNTLTDNPVRPSRPVYYYFILCLKERGERMQEYEVCLIDPMSWRKSREKTAATPCPSHLSPHSWQAGGERTNIPQFLRAEGTLFLAEAGRPQRPRGGAAVPPWEAASCTCVICGQGQWTVAARKERSNGRKTPSRTGDSTMETPSERKGA